MKKSLAALVLLLSVLPGLCAESITLAAAANLTVLERPLSEAFARTHPGETLPFVFGSSGALVTQILNGAPYQAFLAADRSFPQKVVSAGLALGEVRTYATGRLIFLALDPVPLEKGLAVLLEPSVAQFANSNPEIAPYGRAAVEALTRLGLYDQVRAKQVLGQSVTQALQFTVTTTRFGFVSKSALFSPELAGVQKEGTNWIEVDSALYTPLEQGYVVTKAASEAQRRTLEAFFASEAARRVLRDFGYGVP